MSERKPEFCLCNGYDNIWFAGPFDSVEEARAEAELYVPEDEPELRIHGVRYVGPADWLPTVDTIVEWMDEQAYDEGYNHEGDEMHVIAKDKMEEARKELAIWAEKFITLSIERWTGDEIEKVAPKDRKSLESGGVVQSEHGSARNDDTAQEEKESPSETED